MGEIRLSELYKLQKMGIDTIQSAVRKEIHSVSGDTPLEDILPLLTRSNSPIWVVDEQRVFQGTIPLSKLVIEMTGKNKKEINEIIQNAIDL